MSSMSDRPHPAHPTSGARAFARLNTRPANDAGGERPEVAPIPAVETVTLNKIGDFLELDFRRLFVWLRSGLVAAGVLALVGAGAGGAYAVLSPPKYTVSTDILIDPANLQVVADDLFQQPGQVDAALLNAGSKLRVLTSGNVLARVVDDLDLASDKEFYDPTPGFSLSALLPSGDKAEPNPKLEALASLSKKVGTKADETSFVATLFVSSESTEKAIRISEAVVKSFQDELARSESEGASRTAEALNLRLDALKSEVKLAEEKVEAYKRTNNLAASSGELVNTQTMTQLNAQVVEAQGRVIAAQSAYDELVAAGRNASTVDTQASAALTALRAKAADLRAQLGSQSMIYGPRHPAIVKLNTELASTETELGNEVARITAAAKVTLDEAKSGLAALTARATSLKTDVFTDSEALVALRELERDAASKTTIYEAFLARARQVTEREQIDTTNVRVISTAVPPPARSWPPRTVVVMAAGGIGGFILAMLFAVAIGIARDMRRPPQRRMPAAVTA